MMAILSLKTVFMLLAVIIFITVTSSQHIYDGGSEDSLLQPIDELEVVTEDDDMDEEVDVPRTGDIDSEKVLLWEAASKGDVSTMEEVVRRVCHDLVECPMMTALLRERNTLENTALHLAAKSGSVKGVNFLLQHGALTDAREYNLLMPTNMACAAGHSEIVENLLDTLGKLTVNLRDSFGNTALTLAVREGHLNVVKILAPLSDAFSVGDSVIYATEKGNFEIARAILESGVCIEQKKLLKALTAVWKDLRLNLDFLFVHMAYLFHE